MSELPKLPRNLSIDDPESCKHLLLLNHASKCNRKNQACELQHCEKMKQVLHHLEGCNIRNDCPVVHCSSSRQLLFHWKICRNDFCLLCSSVRLVERQTATNVTNEPEIAEKSSSFLSNLSVGNERDGVSETNPASQKDWRHSVTPELRNHLILKLVRAILPTTEPETMNDPRISNLIPNARQIEGNVFRLANSRSEYYHLLAGEIYKIETDISKIRKRIDAQRE